MKKEKFVVFYYLRTSSSYMMRERHFDNKPDAEKFCNEVNGSLAQY